MIVLTAVVLVMLAPVPAGAADCNGPPPGQDPDIVVLIDSGRIRIDHTQSGEAIGAMTSSTPQMAGDSRWRRVGLTRAAFSLRTQATLKMRRLRGGPTYCAWAPRLEVTLFYPELTIFVPRDYPRTSCAYREILAHEHDHVAIHRRVLDHFRPAFHDAAWQAVSALGAFETPSQDAAEQRINSALGQGLAGVRDAFRRAQKAANMALDTATEYRKIQARCTDW